MTDPEKLRVAKLRREGYSYAAIAEMLSEEAEDGRRFDRATIYRVARAMPPTPKDDPFQWHLVEEYGLPWEASRFVLDVFLHYRRQESRFHTDHPDVQRPPNYNCGPSVREVLWCWRVHLALPEEPIEHVAGWADDLALRELARDVFADPFDIAGIEAWFAYRPWIDEEHQREYDQDVGSGIIPARPPFLDLSGPGKATDSNPRKESVEQP